MTTNINHVCVQSANYASPVQQATIQLFLMMLGRSKVRGWVRTEMQVCIKKCYAAQSWGTAHLYSRWPFQDQMLNPFSIWWTLVTLVAT